MELKQFNSLLKKNNAIRISEEYIIFNNYELYSFNTKLSKKYKALESLINKNNFIREIIESTDEFKLEFDGGRGSSSSTGQMGGGFGHADRRGRKSFGKTLYPAEFNTGVRFNSFEEAQTKFESKYAHAEIEYGISVLHITQKTQDPKTIRIKLLP